MICAPAGIASSPAAWRRFAKRTACVLLLSPGRLGMFGASSMPSISPRPRTVWMTLGYFRASCSQAALEKVADLARVVGQLLALDHLEYLQGDRAGERRAAVSGAVRARAEQIGVGRPHPERAHGESAAQRLGHRDAVRQELLAARHAFEDALEALEAAGAEMPALHAVHEQQQLLFVAQLAQAEQVFRRGGRHAAFALDAFDHDGGRRGRKRGAHGGQVVVGHLPEARHHRLKALLDLLLAGGGDACQRPAVEGIEGGDDFKAAFVVAELAGELEQALIGLARRCCRRSICRGR